MEDYIKLEGIFEQGYGIIAKKIMQDKTLCLAAKGLYAYFCSFGGKGSDVFPSRKKICDDLNIGNDTLSKYLSQLEESGYIEITTMRNSGGRFGRNLYKLKNNSPCMDSPCTEKPNTEKPNTEKPHTNNNNNNNNNINNNNIKRKEKSSRPTLFEIEEYIREKNLIVDAKQFFDYFEEGNWTDSKGQKVKNWKQKLLTWNRFQSGKKQTTNHQAREFNRDINKSELEGLFENM